MSFSSTKNVEEDTGNVAKHLFACCLSIIRRNPDIIFYINTLEKLFIAIVDVILIYCLSNIANKEMETSNKTKAEQ